MRPRRDPEKGILITGCGVESVDRARLRAALGLVDLRGAKVQVISVPENLDASKPEERPRPSLGYVGFPELEAFAGSHEWFARGIHTKLWNELARMTGVGRSQNGSSLPKGHLLIGEDHIEVEMFKIGPSADFHAEIDKSIELRTAAGYQLNLDSLQLLADAEMFDGIPYLGARQKEFVHTLAEERQSAA